MMTEWRGTKMTNGRELTLNGQQIFGGRTVSIINANPGSQPSSSQGQRPALNCDCDGDDGIEPAASSSSSSSIGKSRFFFSKDTAVVLTRILPDTIDLQVSKCELNPDGVRSSRRNSESFGYRLIRNHPAAQVTVRQPTKIFQHGKRLPVATPRPAASTTAHDTHHSPGGKIVGALICTKSTLSNPCARQPLVTFRKRSDPIPGSSAGKDEEEPEQNLTDQPRRPHRMSITSFALPSSLTCLEFRDRALRVPPPTSGEPCPFPDPFHGSTYAFQKRIADISSLEVQTVNWEKRKHSKASKLLQTKSG